MKKIYIILALVMFLSACGLRRKDLGMERSKPDATQVSKRKSLILPPDYKVKPVVKEPSKAPSKVANKAPSKEDNKKDGKEDNKEPSKETKKPTR